MLAFYWPIYSATYPFLSSVTYPSIKYYKYLGWLSFVHKHWIQLCNSGSLGEKGNVIGISSFNHLSIQYIYLLSFYYVPGTVMSWSLQFTVYSSHWLIKKNYQFISRFPGTEFKRIFLHNCLLESHLRDKIDDYFLLLFCIWQIILNLNRCFLYQSSRSRGLCIKYFLSNGNIFRELRWYGP